MISQQTSFVRDEKTKALINIDKAALQQHKMQKALYNRIAILEKELAVMKQALTEIQDRV